MLNILLYIDNKWKEWGLEANHELENFFCLPFDLFFGFWEISFSGICHKSDCLIFLSFFLCCALHLLQHSGSPVLGYLAAGILIGPYGLSIIRHVHGTKAIAEFGVVFLLFNIGLEV